MEKMWFYGRYEKDIENDIQQREGKCYKDDNSLIHLKRKLLTEFTKKKKTNDIVPNLEKPIKKLVKNMGRLTGNICIGNEPVGTCFLQRIRPKQDTNGENKYILTFSTTYHVFCKQIAAIDKSEDKYELLAESWNSLDVAVIMCYDSIKAISKPTEDEEKTNGCHFLNTFRLLESDKEIEFINDWCAIECEIDYDAGRNKELLDKLTKSLKQFCELQKEVYELSKTEEFKEINLVVIVGHPHGRPQQVSVGHHYEKLKDVPREVRSGQRWCMYYHDAPTCDGNSGSPVFIFGQPITGFGYWFGHPHNHKQSIQGEEKRQKQNAIKESYWFGHPYNHKQDLTEEEEIEKKNVKIKGLLCLSMTSIGVEQAYK